MDCLSFGHSANSNIYDASVCSYENSGGVSEIAEYKVFKGINLCYYSIHTDHCCFQKKTGPSVSDSPVFVFAATLTYI